MAKVTRFIRVHDMSAMLREIVDMPQRTLDLLHRCLQQNGVTGNFRGVEYFDVSITNGCIVLAPVEIHRAGAVRARLAELKMSETDVREAVEWARGRGP